jgi:hypothetical protein
VFVWLFSSFLVVCFFVEVVVMIDSDYPSQFAAVPDSWDSLWSERCVLLEEGVFEMSDRELCDSLDAVEDRLFVFDSVRWLRVLEVENV